MHQQQTAFENMVEKGEIALEISPFQTMFSTQSNTCIPTCTFFLHKSSSAAEFEAPKIGISGKGFRIYFFNRVNI